MTLNRKAQVEVTFNWIYVVVAGGLILLFFGLIVYNQAKVSEEDLSRDIVRIMDSIFSASSVSENTKNVIDISGLAEYTLFFSCEEEITKFGIEGSSASKENEINPIFSPQTIKGTRLITWSVPYKFPFKVIDLLIITSENSAYLLWGENDFTKDLLKATQNTSGAKKSEVKLNIKSVNDFNTINIGKPYQVRIIDVNGQIKSGASLPSALLDKVAYLEEDKVTAVSFLGGNMINYFVKEEDHWKLLNRKPIYLLSIDKERDSAKYAAVFSGTPEIYQCNMNKALKRLEYLNQIYGGKNIGNAEIGGKLKDLVDYYNSPIFYYGKQECLGSLTEFKDNVKDALIAHQMNAASCRLKSDTCSSLIVSAQTLRNANQRLGESGDCVSLY